MLFNSDIVNFLLKTNRGVTKSLILLSFLEWSALIVVGWWWRVAKSCLGSAEVRLKFYPLVCHDITALLITTASLDPQTNWS